MTGPIWQPSRERIRQANITRYIQLVQREYCPAVHDFASLYRWSIDQPREFWPSVWSFCGIEAQRGWDSVVTDLDRMTGARWFDGARINFAENLLRYRDSRPALLFRNEAGQRSSLTYAELGRQVASLAGALREAGVAEKDRVVGFMPNIPETVIAMLAAASLGAIWSSCSPDFGINGVLDRFGQIGPKVLFTADGYSYNGKRIDSLESIRGLLRHLPSVETVIVVPYAGGRPSLGSLPGGVLYADVLEAAASAPQFVHLPFDHPLYIMYSSGTTGAPKCIVHGAGGTLIQHLKELVLHTDVKREDTVFYFTTCGWMMWNWLVSSLAAGATVLLYDGSPMHPGPEALWRIAAEERVTVFGTSAKYLSAVEKAGVNPGRDFDLASLKAVLSTGSPLAPESFDYVYRDIKEDVCLSSISGGTDIISCFALGNPIGPVYRGELQTRGLGMKVEILDESGAPVREERGELSCTQPFPSMPIYFWNDPDGERYRSSYFDKFPNVWCHGDYAELTEHDGLIIHGRSDATLNPGGVRIGTAEIYRVVEKLPEVLESLAVGQDWEGDVRVILFVVLREGYELDEELRQGIRTTLRSEASPRHVPAKIVQVRELPRTISGKIVELAVQNVIHGRAVTNRDALANPDALELFRDLPELKT
jgi:acetoacetyl-CoA synthetase